MKSIYILFICLLCVQLGKAQEYLVKPHDNPRPNEKQLAWQKAEMGAVFHYDLHVFDGVKYSQGGDGGNRTNPVLDYQIFNPDKLDTDQWIKAAKDAGFKFAILTATHETGFALYQSDVNPYCLKAVKWRDGKGDIVKDFVESCRKYDIEPGIYLGIRWNSFFGVHNFQVNGEGQLREARQEYYNKLVEGMVTEICTQYGELFEIWFDGGASHPDLGAPDVLPIVLEHQPNCLFYHNNQYAEARWGGSESGTGFTLKLDKKIPVKHIVIQEDIEFGERIREYLIEGRDSGKWIRIEDGTCIGQKRIIELEENQYSKIRLRITTSIDMPKITLFAAY